MRIVVGLGNPGRAYANTRHNVGFMVVDRLAARWNIDLVPAGGGLRRGDGCVAGVPVTLAIPQRYMNLSGEALEDLEGDWCPQDLIVVYDDLDLPVGQIRIRHDGGSGGHRGAESVIARWGSDFDRVRIGIGRPPVGENPADYVLTELEAVERRALDEAVELASDAVECLVRDGLEKAMNQFNGRGLLNASGVA